jgi:UDP-N-acetylglucosamine pyrophosphorylase
MLRTERFFSEFATKMRGAGMSDAAIRAFEHSYGNLVSGQKGLIPESSIQPVPELPRLGEGARKKSPDRALLAQTVVIKLNGGLGTSMGLDRAKSLLQVKNGLTFLDLFAKQILHARQRHGVALRCLLMNSFSTSPDTQEFLKGYRELGEPESLELMQNQVPKVDAATLRPVSWPKNPQLEWCPPGHGDLYPSLLGSGRLDRLLSEGVKYLFVSNSDNLGASLDLGLLSYFAESENDFLMEAAERTNSDRKGGHLAQQNGRLLLRESAQCPKADEAAFQDIRRHRFFNTNNLWIRLDSLKERLQAHEGFIPLALIKNAKTVDPRDKNSPAVLQLETAMGAAIACFEKAGAVVVPRTRFAPVKTTSDLMALRSDAYCLTEDWRIVLSNPESSGPPRLDLDGNHYQLVDQLDEKLASGVPSLKDCRELVVRGPVLFSSGNIFKGRVTITNDSPNARGLPPGEYCDRAVAM